MAKKMQSCTRSINYKLAKEDTFLSHFSNATVTYAALVKKTMRKTMIHGHWTKKVESVSTFAAMPILMYAYCNVSPLPCDHHNEQFIPQQC